jgi:hypothetical protein
MVEFVFLFFRPRLRTLDCTDPSRSVDETIAGIRTADREIGIRCTFLSLLDDLVGRFTRSSRLSCTKDWLRDGNDLFDNSIAEFCSSVILGSLGQPNTETALPEDRTADANDIRGTSNGWFLATVVTSFSKLNIKPDSSGPAGNAPEAWGSKERGSVTSCPVGGVWAKGSRRNDEQDRCDPAEDAPEAGVSKEGGLVTSCPVGDVWAAGS